MRPNPQKTVDLENVANLFQQRLWLPSLESRVCKKHHLDLD